MDALFELQSNDFGGVIFIPLMLFGAWWAQRDSFRKYEAARLAYSNERLRRIRNLEI